MDTVVLDIPNGSYQITEPRKFTPWFEPFDPYDTNERIRFLQEFKGHKRYIQNPPSEYRDKGQVHPNLAIDENIRRFKYTCNFRPSFSCPKLIWGHSIEEIQDSHKSLIVDTLVGRLSNMGVTVTKEAILTATVQTLHYCANIMFPNEADARLFLERLSKTSIGGWFENNTKTFSSDGHAVRFHTDIFEIIFYLKYYDILENRNRAISKRATLQEKEIAKRLLAEGKIPPVVRMEIRMNGTRSIQTHLRTALGVDKKYWTFEETLDSIRSRATLRYYWDKIIDDPLNHAILCDTSDKDICEKVIAKYSGVKFIQISEAMGLFYYLRSMGVKGTRSIIVLRQSRKTWYEKRKKIATFAKRFMKPDETLINIVTKVLENKPIQLRLPM